MKTALILCQHATLPDQQMVELWHNGQLIGAVYGADGPGLRIISKHPIQLGGFGQRPNLIELHIDPTRVGE